MGYSGAGGHTSSNTKGSRVTLASNKQGGGEGAALLILIALFFFSPIPLKESPAPLDYHIQRFLGVPQEAPPKIIEQEVVLAADHHGIDRRLFKALIKVESGWNPRALSHAGAMGLAQIMPFNHRRCGLRSPRQLWDVVHNTRCGAQILAEELQTYNGDVVKALQAYNGGPKCVGRCRESIQYSAKVLANRESLAG
jgi:soluble lytic murein transglycosylase-like protein